MPLPRRVPGQSLLTAIRRDYAERNAAGDVTLGPPTLAFARMVQRSHVLTSRGREIEDLREQARSATPSRPRLAQTTRSSGSQRHSSPRFTGYCSPKPPGASWTASRATRSARCSRRPRAGPSACLSRPWAATASEPGPRSGRRGRYDRRHPKVADEWNLATIGSPIRDRPGRTSRDVQRLGLSPKRPPEYRDHVELRPARSDGGGSHPNCRLAFQLPSGCRCGITR